VGGNHTEIAASPFLESIETGLEIADFGGELTITLAQLVILASLRCHRVFEAIELANAILGEPNPVLEEEYDES